MFHASSSCWKAALCSEMTETTAVGGVMGAARDCWVSFPEAQVCCCHLALAGTVATGRPVASGTKGAVKAMF